MTKTVLVCFIILLPTLALAQNASNALPGNKSIKDTSKQTDLIDIAKSIFHIKAKRGVEPKEVKVFFSFTPFGTTVPGGTGKALITSINAGSYLGPKATTRMSTATFAPYFNFKGRFGLPLRSNIWFPNNKYYIQGDTRFLVYPQYTWGLGTTRAQNDKVLIDYRYIRFYQNVYRRLRPYLFAGVGYNLDYHTHILTDDKTVSLPEFTKYDIGTSGNSFSSGFSLNVLYDTRNSSVSPVPESFFNIQYRNNPGFLGSKSAWQSLYADYRKYITLNKSNRNQQNTLALWSYYWTALTNGTPYLSLPSVGWDPFNRSARGIDQNRYRGKSLFYAESEYRRDITRNGLLGFVLFTNVNTVSGSGTFGTSWHPAAGTGLRIKFSKVSKVNIAIDYGVSKGFSKLILGIGEAF